MRIAFYNLQNITIKKYFCQFNRSHFSHMIYTGFLDTGKSILFIVMIYFYIFKNLKRLIPLNAIRAFFTNKANGNTSFNNRLLRIVDTLRIHLILRVFFCIVTFRDAPTFIINFAVSERKTTGYLLPAWRLARYSFHCYFRMLWQLESEPIRDLLILLLSHLGFVTVRFIGALFTFTFVLVDFTLFFSFLCFGEWLVVRNK